MIFKYSEYRDLLKHLKKLGKVTTFRDWKKDKAFLLRHDVDLDIRLAHDVAKIEHEEGVTSTFFILTTCPTYNVLSNQNQKYLREIEEWGSEIGLHFDPLVYGKDDLSKGVEKECEILSFVLGHPVRSISLHNPSIHQQFPLFPGYINAYDPEIFDNEYYISDSRMDFRGKDIFEFVKRVNQHAVQILFHPMHFSEQGYGYDEIMKKYIQQYVHDIHAVFSANGTYSSHVKGDLIDVICSKRK